MRIPRGRLVRSRAAPDPAVPLRVALETELTGYARFEPQEAVLLDGDARGVLTFRDGVPVLAYSAATDRGGPAALADLAMPGPCAADLYELPPEELAPAHRTESLRVPPGMPAERLAGDAALAARTREAAPEDRAESGDGGDAADPVEAFLADEEKVEAIRRRARREARDRAAEWGLTDELADAVGGDDPSGGPDDREDGPERREEGPEHPEDGPGDRRGGLEDDDGGPVAEH